MIKIYDDMVQGSEEWHAARCGMLTASEMKLIITPTLKPASNDKERSHLYELLAQRVSGYVEPSYVSDDMLRGSVDENSAGALYCQNYADAKACGFITNHKFGFAIGYSPDALVGDDGAIEIKSREQKYQIETFVMHVDQRTVPSDYIIQIQTGLLVSQRKWCDFISYSGGLPMAVIRCNADQLIQEAIVEAATAFEKRLAVAHERYTDAVTKSGAYPTERTIVQEMYA